MLFQPTASKAHLWRLDMVSHQILHADFECCTLAMARHAFHKNQYPFRLLQELDVTPGISSETTLITDSELQIRQNMPFRLLLQASGA